MKKILSIILIATLLLALPCYAFATGGSPKIVDEADLLLDYQQSMLETKAIALTEQYGIDVVILTVKSTQGKDVTAFADDYFDYNGYGIGSDNSGILLMLSMEDRDWVISTTGKGIEALTDYGQEQIMVGTLEYLRDDQYFQGFNYFVTELDSYFDAYKQGAPIDYQPDAFDYVFYAFIALGIGALVGFITITVMKSGMKTAVFQHGAYNYVKQGSCHITQQQDIFLYSTVSRFRRSSDNSSRGGSSTHRGSSGSFHGGSRGKF